MSDRVGTEALAEVVVNAMFDDGGEDLGRLRDYERDCYRRNEAALTATAILESSWLAARDARVRADAASDVYAGEIARLETSLANARKLGHLSGEYLAGYAAAIGWLRLHRDNPALRAHPPAASSVGSGVGEGTL